MALNNAYNQYKQNSIYTASPEELTLMLYNGLVKFLMQAQAACEKKEIEKTHNSIKRAQDILTEFRETLDRKYPIAENLDALYDYMYRRLVDANIAKDAEIVDEVLGIAKELRDTWSQAIKIVKKKPVGSNDVDSLT
nr:flagellar export chaperone FliS [Sedimentibacter sp.]